MPGCGGAFKLVPEDFEVEELPAYLPSGEGEHLYLWVEKRGRDTREVVRALAAALGVPEGDVGVAGMKDRQAVTRQWLSVPARAEARAADFALEGVRVLWSAAPRQQAAHRAPAGKPLPAAAARREGRGRGARELRPAGGARACPTTSASSASGATGDNAELGRLLLLGERLPRRPDRFQRKLYLSAFQSRLFNRALVAAAARGHLRHGAAGRRAAQGGDGRALRLRGARGGRARAWPPSR